MYPNLNLPKAELKIDQNRVWDIIRQKYILNTPEEWVRQHFIHYLVHHLNYSRGLLMVEHLVKYNQLNKRCDILCSDSNGKPLVVIECKAFDVSIGQDVLFQIAKYNYVLKAPFLILTNGIEHIACKLNTEKNELNFLNEIPNFQTIKNYFTS